MKIHEVSHWLRMVHGSCITAKRGSWPRRLPWRYEETIVKQILLLEDPPAHRWRGHQAATNLLDPVSECLIFYHLASWDLVFAYALIPACMMLDASILMSLAWTQGSVWATPKTRQIKTAITRIQYLWKIYLCNTFHSKSCFRKPKHTAFDKKKNVSTSDMETNPNKQKTWSPSLPNKTLNMGFTKSPHNQHNFDSKPRRVLPAAPMVSQVAPKLLNGSSACQNGCTRLSKSQLQVWETTAILCSGRRTRLSGLT